MAAAEDLRSLLTRPGLLQVPGCFDALSALLVEKHGFEAAYLTGFGVSAAALGLPDLGLLSFREMADRVTDVASRISIPLLADADTGYGDATNVYRTVKSYARAGAAAIQLEDQVWPKRCGHTQGKQVVPLPDAVGKIRAAADARAEQDIVIIARTDARAPEGFAAALDRCAAYAEAGADVIFFEAPESREEVAQIATTLGVPLLFNVVEGGRSPMMTRQELEALGYKIAIYPVTLLLAALDGMLRHLGPGGPGPRLDPWQGPPDLETLTRLVGFQEFDRKRR